MKEYKDLEPEEYGEWLDALYEQQVDRMIQHSLNIQNEHDEEKRKQNTTGPSAE